MAVEREAQSLGNIAEKLQEHWKEAAGMEQRMLGGGIENKRAAACHHNDYWLEAGSWGAEL